jgi:hypothetical protein
MVFPETINHWEKTCPECGQHRPIGSRPTKNKKGKKNEASECRLSISMFSSCHKVSASALPCPLSMMFCLRIGSWVETSEAMRKNQPFFLLNCFPQVFVTAMKN